MTKFPLISDILHNAADHHLSDGTKYDYWNNNKFSCCAVEVSIENSIDTLNICGRDYMIFNDQVFSGLRELGCDTGSLSLFTHLKPKEQQQARYFWLKWAALQAEEQGV